MCESQFNFMFRVGPVSKDLIIMNIRQSTTKPSGFETFLVLSSSDKDRTVGMKSNLRVWKTKLSKVNNVLIAFIVPNVLVLNSFLKITCRACPQSW